MKKAVKGKSYNTETARMICSWDNNLPANDFGWCSATLHQKATGAYFIHAEGGAMSRYASRMSDGSYGYGEDIIVIADETAKRIMDLDELREVLDIVDPIKIDDGE